MAFNKCIICICIIFLTAYAITREEEAEIISIVQRQLNYFAEKEVGEKLDDFSRRLKRLEGNE